MGQQGDGFGFILEGRCAVAALDEGSVLAMARCDFGKGVRNRSPRSLSQTLMIRDGKFVRLNGKFVRLSFFSRFTSRNSDASKYRLSAVVNAPCGYLEIY